MKVLWNTASHMINQQITMETRHHKVNHIFRVGRGMDTASLKSIMFQHLASIREEVLSYDFLDLKKAYDAMDREWCLEIMLAYGVRPWMTLLLRT